MTNARGDQAKLQMRRQADFDTIEPAADGKFHELPFYSFNMKPSEDTSEDDAIRGDAFPGEVVAGLRNLTGSIEVPLGFASIGWHLAGLFGLPTTTDLGGGNFSHVFKTSADPVLLFHTIGVDHTVIDVHFKQKSVVYGSMDMSMKKDGQRSRVTFGLLGVSETQYDVRKIGRASY